MTSYTLLSDDGTTQVWEVRNGGGQVIGEDRRPSPGAATSPDVRASAHVVPAPDGTNDQTIITTALATAAAAGLSVTFPPGATYVLTPTANDQTLVDIPGPMVIDLNGSTLKIGTNGYPKVKLLGVVNRGGQTIIRNGTLRGDRLTHDYTTTVATHEHGYGISIDRSNVLIDDVEACDMTGDGAITIDYTDLGGGDYADGTHTVEFRRFRTHRNRRQGISVLCSNVVIVDDCDIYDIGTFDGITGTNPMAGIDLEPASRTMRIVDMRIRNTRITVPTKGLAISHEIASLSVDGCRIIGQVLVENGTTSGDARITNSVIEWDYVTPYSIPSLGTGFQVINTTIRCNRFDIKCRVVGSTIETIDNPTETNRISIYPSAAISDTTFTGFRAADYKGVWFVGTAGAATNAFTTQGVTLGDCDVWWGNGGESATTYDPTTRGVRFVNCRLAILRERQTFAGCYFEACTTSTHQTYYTASLVRLIGCEYHAPDSTVVLSGVRKEITGSTLTLAGIGATVLAQSGQPNLIANSTLHLGALPAAADMPNGKIINCLLRVAQSAATIDFTAMLTNTAVEFDAA